MSDERIDLSALEMAEGSERFERIVGQITWRARMELARRAALRQVNPVEAVAAWYRPAIAAAAAIAVISVTVLTTMGRHHADVQPGAYMSGAEVPDALTSWYEEGSSPTAAELLVANEEAGNGHLR